MLRVCKFQIVEQVPVLSSEINSERAGRSKPVVVRWVSEAGPGHQSAYDELLKPIFRSLGFIVVEDPAAPADAVFHATLDFDYPALLRSSFRSLVGGPRTVALFLRPQNCLRPIKPVHRIKQLLFRVLRRIPSVSILTILPFDLEPRLASYARDWINDPQLWDLRLLAPEALILPPAPPTDARPAITMLGRLDHEKGFDQFATLWIENPGVREKYRFVAAGKVDPAMAGLADDFVEAGGTLIDERISDDRMFGLFHESTAIWCAYDRHYDQASGIFGRAFQFGLPTIVTAGSFLEKQSAGLRQQSLAVSPDWEGHSQRTAGALLDWTPHRADAGEREAEAARLRHRDVERLTAILRGNPTS